MSTGFFSRFRRKSQEEKAAAYANGEKRSWSPFKNWKKPNTSLPNGPDMGKYGKYDPREDHDEDDYNYPSYDKPKAKVPTQKYKQEEHKASKPVKHLSLDDSFEGERPKVQMPSKKKPIAKTKTVVPTHQIAESSSEEHIKYQKKPVYKPPQRGEVIELPLQVRLAVQKVINRRVTERIHEEMEIFREDLDKDLMQVRRQSFVADDLSHRKYTVQDQVRPVGYGNPYIGSTAYGKPAYNAPPGTQYPGHPNGSFGGYQNYRRASSPQPRLSKYGGLRQ